jgi:hypothetical protein
MINYKKINKVLIRNLHESCDFHDLVKTQLYRMLRRENKNIEIYTEEQLNGEIPDIYLKYKGKIIVWEIQEEDTKAWYEKIKKRYADVDLIIVPLKKLSRNFEELGKQLNDYVVRVK